MSGTAARSVALAVLLLVATVSGPAAAVAASQGAPGGSAPSEPAGTAAASTTTSQPSEGVVEHELHLAEPGTARVDLTVTLVDGTTEFEVTLPRNATVTASEGFDPANSDGAGPTYAWDGRTESPSLRYRAPVNRTVGGSQRFVATGDWALLDTTDLDTAYRWRSFGEVDYRRTFTAPDGHVGRAMAFLGDHRTATRTANGERFVVVVPAVASANASAGAFADTLASLSGRFDVGARSETVTAFIAPAPIGTDGGGEGGLGGLATASDLWVAAGTATEPGPDGQPRIRTAIWVHEYLHTRQNYSLAPGLRWFTEASAYHYMATVPLQRGELDDDAFRRRYRVADGRQDAVLRGSRRYDVWSEKGARVLAALDRRIRAATNGSRSLQGVLRRMNAHEGEVTAAEFREMVAATAGAPQDAWLDEHVGGRALPPKPDPDAYPAANVSLDPAAVEYERGAVWIPVADGPLPAGVPVRVRHPTAGVVVLPGNATAVNVSGGDPATVELPAGGVSLRVATFYGNWSTTLPVETSDDVDGDGVSNAAERAAGSDPFDADSTPTPTPGSDGGDGAGSDGDDPADTANGTGPGFGSVAALAAVVVVAAAMRRFGR